MAALFGPWADLSQFQTVDDVLDHFRVDHFRVDEAVWLAFERQVGSPGSDLRLLASLPQVALVTGCNNALTDNGPFSPIEATQVGLVWRLAKRIMAARSNVTEENFIDVDPWMEQQSRDNDPRGEQQQRASGSSGVKGKNFENECTDRST